MKNLSLLSSLKFIRDIDSKWVNFLKLKFFDSTNLNIFILLFIPGFSYCQELDVNFAWAKHMGGPSSFIRAHASSFDINGNVYTTGYFAGTIDFDPDVFEIFNLTSDGNYDIFVTKIDSLGNFIWAKQFISEGNDSGAGNDIVIDEIGNAYILGSFAGTIDFDPGVGFNYLTAYGNHDIFVSKISPMGEFIWAKQFGDEGDDFGYSMTLDENGYIYMSANSTNCLIYKLDSQGSILWFKQIEQCINPSIKINDSGNVYLVGNFYGNTVDFDPGLDTYYLDSNNGGAFVLKLSPTGNFISASQFASNIEDFTIDINGYLLTTGNFKNNFLTKLDSLGNIVWEIRLAEFSQYNNFSYSISTDLSGNIYTTGKFLNTVDFDPSDQVHNLTSNVYNIFISKFDPTGNYLWAIRLDAGQGKSIQVDYNGNIFTTGPFVGPVDFDPSSSTFIISPNFNSINCFILKFQQPNSCFPSILISHPNNQIKPVCSVATFTATAHGTPPIQYAWYKNNILIPNSNAPSYTTPPLTISDNGNSYYCIVSNCNGINKDTSNNAILNVNAPCIYSNPGITLSSSTLIPGQSLNINGLNFTNFGEIELTIRNESGELVGQNVSINYINPGKFSFTLPITNTFLDGLYSVNAIDLSTGYSAPLKTFRVNNLNTHTLKIKSPSAGSSYVLGNLFDIIWSDVALSNTPVSQTGFVNKTYHVEISNNNGVSWTNVGVGIYSFKADVAKLKPFSTRYSLINSGTYIIKISDNDNPSNFSVSQPFIINSCNSAGFKSSLHWDVTVPQDIKVETDPIGLAADGTARLFVKLKKNTSNLKSVSSITASILPFGSIESGPGLLGKIMYATNHKTYSEEANNASLTSILHNAVQYGNSNSNEYWFWLVAPDDFTTELDFEGSKREIIVEFTISYTDNSTEEIITCKPIGIFRPALMFVHGIAGNEESFKYTRFLNNSGSLSSFDFSGEWETVRRINLKEFDSFENNAKVILGVDADENYKFENSFQSLLREMHIDGIANKRVDYIAHSMGGVVGRTAINYGNQWYSPGIGMYKNYSKGYINKFITLNTPHNGSYLADYAIDLFPRFVYRTPILPLFPLLGDLGYIDKGAVSPAGLNLQAHSGGVKLGETQVRNHLLSSDLDPSNNYSEKYIIDNLQSVKRDFQFIKSYHFPISMNERIENKYNNSEFLSETDGIVQISSQLAGKNKNDAVNIVTTPFGLGTTSILSGIDKFHIGIQRDISVGTRIKTLLNAGINSGFFADDIPANPNFQNFTSNDDNIAARIVTLEDSVFYRYDTLFCKIISPTSDTIVMVDSTIQIKVKLKDTTGLQNLALFFQSGVYYSESTDSIQSFQINVNQENLGKNFVLAIAQYDSLGYMVSHIDTICLQVSTLEQKTGFSVTPESRHLNPNQSFKPDYFVEYPTFIGQLFAGVDTFTFEIMDTNVVFFDSVNYEFVTKDTGTTHIVFEYSGFMDTIFIYVSELIDKNVYSLCPQGNISLYAGSNDPNKDYQWQLDTLDSFINISDNSIYTGTTSSTLLITNAPTNLYDHTYRCLISDVVGSAVSDSYTLKFGSVWTGAVDTTWENPLNWNCESIPSSYTDVLIPADVPRYPHVNSFAYSRSIKLAKNAKLDVSSGYLLCVGNSSTGLTCPSDTIIYVASGISEISVDYQLQTIGNCSGSILQTLGIPSGGLFPLGSTTNCFELRDEQNVIVGNCCFDVLVISSISIVLAIPGPTVTEISLTQHPVNVDLWSAQVFIAAGVKFRANNSWVLYWGGEIFPSGTASLNGNYIGIPEAGTYMVTFNTRTLAYNFTLLCPSSISFTSQNQIDNFTTDYPTCLEILGDLTISGTDIWNLSGLSQITSIEGTLGIYNNPNLSDFTGLSGITNVGSGLNIIGNSSLTNLNGLNTLNSVLGYVFINNNASLSSLFGLNGLNTIGQYLSIGGPGGNPSLTSLNGLQSLSTVGGNLQIHGNNALSSLAGLNSLTIIGGSLNIGNNSALSTCSIQAICEHLSIPSNEANISSNSSGCNNVTEVEYACVTCIGNISLTSQAQIDAFPINYPTCNTITGNVYIYGQDITNLNGLAQITSIGNDLRIHNCPNLISIFGLNNLSSIGQNLYFYNIPNLTSLVGLDGLVSIPGSLTIGDLHELIDLTGLNALTTIGGTLALSENTNLINLDGLGLLSSIGNNLYIYNNALISLYGLNSVTYIGNSFELSGNAALTSLNGLNSLINIGGDVAISNNAILETLNGINSLISIGGGLYLTQNNVLSTLNGLISLTMIGDELVINNNPALTMCNVQGVCNFLSIPSNNFNIFYNDFGCDNQAQVQTACGIPVTCPANITFSTQAEIDSFISIYNGCSTITGNVIIEGNDINNVIGLNLLTTVGGNLIIINNPLLSSLDGLNNITHIGGQLGIENNVGLLNLIGLNSLTSIGEAIIIDNNDLLTDLTGLNSINTMNQGLSITNNNGLLSLNGLNGITEIGDIAISNNNSLTSLSGLENLTYVVNDIYFDSNNALQDLSHLSNLTYVGSGLGFGSNSSLLNLSGLNSLSYVRSLSINNNSSLESLTGLDSLHKIAELLYIGDNPSLTSLSGLSGVDSIGQTIVINNNINLTSLSALENIDISTVNYLYIVGSTQLSICNTNNICTYLSNPNNIAEISNNATGCSSRAEVEAECGN